MKMPQTAAESDDVAGIGDTLVGTLVHYPNAVPVERNEIDGGYRHHLGSDFPEMTDREKVGQVFTEHGRARPDSLLHARRYHSEWMALPTALECLREIGRYGPFTGRFVADAFARLPQDTPVVIAREGSPVVYAAVDDCRAAMRSVLPVTSSQEVKRERFAKEQPPVSNPLEFGAHYDAESIPTTGVGHRLDAVDPIPGVLRAYWDG